MKKVIALLIAAVTLAASLSACASSNAKTVHADIRTTSSDAAQSAAWLAERLGEKLTDRVVLGTNADGYGANLSALENDGYIIRSVGGEVALFARTENGLDRAVRKYAKSVEAGTAIGDVSYHEGARIKKLSISGRDISEYTIYSEDETYMLKAANELSARIAQATGAALAVSTAEPAENAIILRYVNDEALKNVGYRWSVKGSALIIDCSDACKAQSASAAVARFLEKRLDWFGLSYGFEDLTPAEHIDIADGESGGETPTFLWGRPHGGQRVYFDSIQNDRFSFGPDIHACHGLQNNKFAGELSTSKNGNWESDQPCYLDEEFFEVSYDDISAYIKRRLEGGAVIGSESFSFVDIAAGDNSAWCQCKSCRKMFREQGATESGAVITWANRLSGALNEEFPGLHYGVFAYAGTNKPPKTVVPNEHLIITYCYDGSCSAHSLDGRDCNGDYPVNLGDKEHGNAEMTKQLKGWTDLTKNVVIWYYGLGNALLTMSFIHTVRDDVTLFYELGVIGAYWESEDGGFDTGWVSDWLANELMWDIDMTDEEYEAFYDRVLSVLYGDGGTMIKDYITAQDGFYASGPCVTCWAWGFYISPSLPTPFWKKYYDNMFALTEAARLQADSSRQQRLLDNLSVECIYKGSVSSYFAEFNAGNDERIAELSRRYSLINERMTKYGVDMTKFLAADLYGTSLSYDPDLEVTMWYGYKTAPAYCVDWYPDHPERPIPERAAEALADMDAEYLR